MQDKDETNFEPDHKRNSNCWRGPNRFTKIKKTNDQQTQNAGYDI